MKTRKIMTMLLTASMMMSMATGCGKKTAKKAENNNLTMNVLTEKRENGQEAIFELVQKPITSSSYEPAKEDEENKKAYAKFIFELMKNCLEEADGKNVMISPDSIFFALSMTAAGANGDTLNQMMNTMVPGRDTVEAFGYSVKRMNSLKNDSLKIANSLWINEGRSQSVYDDYLEYVKKNYEAGVDVLPFDAGTADKINEWVSKKTDGRISKLLEDVDSTSLMVLVNAITFDGQWAERYEDYQVAEGEFTTASGKKQKVKMLSGSEGVYFCSTKAEGFAKDYDDGKYTFLTILPKDESVDINEFMANFTSEDYWEFWESSSHEYSVSTLMPEFKSEYDIELPKILERMGMKNAFSPAEADFTNMCKSNAYISNVIHKTFIEVDRAGTKAAAATAVVMTESCVMEPEEVKKVYCDRPYAYAIVDRDTGLPVFLGTVENV